MAIIPKAAEASTIAGDRKHAIMMFRVRVSEMNMFDIGGLSITTHMTYIYSMQLSDIGSDIGSKSYISVDLPDRV